MNSKIEFSDKVAEFLKRNILEKRKLRFDFERHEGQWFKMDKELSQDYPSLDAIMGLAVVFSFIIIPILFGFFGNSYFYEVYGRSYPIYRNILVVFSGILSTISLVNIFMALTSQYLGHKVTIMCLAVSAILLVGGLV